MLCPLSEELWKEASGIIQFGSDRDYAHKVFSRKLKAARKVKAPFERFITCLHKFREDQEFKDKEAEVLPELTDLVKHLTEDLWKKNVDEHSKQLVAKVSGDHEYLRKQHAEAILRILQEDGLSWLQNPENCIQFEQLVTQLWKSVNKHYE